jgi:hypothetical protein
MNKEFARRLIEHPNEETTSELFEGIDGIFWVDWREADNYIVKLASQTLTGVELKAFWADDKLKINYQGQVTEVPLRNKPGDQEITLRTLNRVIAPDFEFRFVKASDGGDTLAFMMLNKESWSELEAEFGPNVGNAFQKTADDVSFFGYEEE